MSKPGPARRHPLDSHGVTTEILEMTSEGTALADVAYERLRDRIIRVEIAPGTPLQESRLSEDLGVGLTPIRSAIRRLSFEHLVTVYPRWGTFAAKIDIGGERWLTEVRLEVEGLSAYVAAQRASGAQRRELMRLAKAMASARTNSEVTDLDALFHRQIFAATHNPFLRRTAELHFHLALRIWYFCNQSFTVSEMRGADQLAIAQAIAAKDGDAAKHAMQRHLEHASQAICNLLTRK